MASAKEMVPELTIRKTSTDEFSRYESYWACRAGRCSVSCGETHPGESPSAPWDGPPARRAQLCGCHDLHRGGGRSPCACFIALAEPSTYRACAGEGRDFPEAVCMRKQPPPAQKMGQKVSHEDNQENKAETLVICEVFSQGVVHASQRLKDYLGFVDPQSKFQPATNTLSEIFLVNFIGFCVEKGVEERITTSKMTKQQSSLFGVDWIWTLSGADKQIKLQIAVQALQLAELFHSEGGPAEAVEDCCREAVLADERFRNRSRFEKLAEFCRLVGRDCLGLFVMFGVPGKPKDIRGVLLDSIAKEEQKCCLSGRSALRQFVTSTDSFLPTKDMLENCLGAKNGPKEVGNVYINFL